MSSPRANLELAQNQARRFLGGLPVTVHEQDGGLSGARVWRVESERGTFALRQYHVEFPTEERLGWLHGFLKEIQDRGCTLLPCPVATREGPTWIKYNSNYWELLTWVHGMSLLDTQPTHELLIAAASTLAQLHLVTAQLSSNAKEKPDELFPSVGRGLSDRECLARRWQNQDAVLVEQQLEKKNFSPKLRRLFQLQQAALRKHFTKVENLFQQAVQGRDRLIPVLRDVQPGHVIFAGTKVAGFIDLTAARVDSALGDLARLLHRWRYAEPNWYADAVAAYHKIRPLVNDERIILEAYDFSARLLTGVQWLSWVVLEEREFGDQALVEQHWERVEGDLGQLLDSSGSKVAKSGVIQL
jgi:Ser/Thr protein kinase RdoA (MazF antagonist)